MNPRHQSLLIFVAMYVLYALFLGDLAWVFNHAAQITMFGIVVFIFVLVMHKADDVRSRYAFDIGELCRAKLLGYERSELDRKVDFLRHEWIRYLKAARFRAADRTRQLLDAAEEEQRLLRDKQRQHRDKYER